VQNGSIWMLAKVHKARIEKAAIKAN